MFLWYNIGVVNENQNQNRKSIRLKEYDYSEPGDYFITICTQNRGCLFGEVVDEKIVLNEVGQIAERCYLEIPKHFPNVELDIFQIMPNHIHFLIRIMCQDNDNQNCRGAVSAPNGQIQRGETPPLQKTPTLGQVVGYFKYQTTKKINEISGTIGAPIFQRNYYEEIIKNEKHYSEVYTYIESNPQVWDRDIDNPNKTI